MEKQKKQQKSQTGITLIALVITIIVLLILAGVSIAMITGKNGILEQAQHAKTNTERASVIEEAKTDVLGKQAENESDLITRAELKTVIDKYFRDVPEDYKIDTVLKTKDEYGKHEISVSEIYNGKFKISKTESYVGYYADINNDGIVDGIIYADLAIGNTGSGQWGSESGDWNDEDVKYTIPVAENLKDYYISKTSYEGNSGTKDVISPTGSGNERFYVMALTDIDGKQNGTRYDWYNAAYYEMDDYATTTSTAFGKGKENTRNMIEKWDGEKYGKQDQCADNHKDMWGQIKSEVSKGWFVPSKEELLAFGGELGITTENYADYNLSDYLWSSSQLETYGAYLIGPKNALLYIDTVNDRYCVRLSTIF